jgi:calcineurin-like phosphoesterase family protein
MRDFWDEDNVIDAPVTAENPSGAEALPDTAEHDAWLADIWDSTLRKDDQVFVLGDISINGGQYALDWIAARPGVKHLIAGNHDPVGPWDRRSTKLLPQWLRYFETIQPYLRRRLDGHNFLLSHFPYWPSDRGAPRYEQYRLPNLGLPLLHGHVHSNQKFEYPNQFHVGVDAWEGHLVTQEFVMEWLAEQKEKKVT